MQRTGSKACQHPCDQWANEPARMTELEMLLQLPPCPCTKSQAKADDKFTGGFFVTNWITSFFHGGCYCVRQTEL